MTDKIAEAKELAAQLGLDEPDDGAFLAKEFGMHGMPAEQVRDLEVIEGEILFYKRQSGMALIEIGKRLNEAKAQLGHGEWLPWLREKIDISERSAQDFMRLAREYSKSAEIADLGASKALALLALPVSERSEFMQEKHLVNGEEKAVSDMTAAELKRAIKERDEARLQNDALKKEMENQLADAQQKNEALQKTIEAKQDQLNEAEQTADALLEELDALKKKPVEVAVEKVADIEAIKKAVKDATDAQKKKHADEVDKLRRRAEEAEAQKKQMEAAAAEVKKKAEAAGDAEKYRAEAEALRKQLAMSDAGIVAFKAKFEGLQAAFATVRSAMGALEPEARKKMEAALRTQLDAWSSLFASE